MRTRNWLAEQRNRQTQANVSLNCKLKNIRQCGHTALDPDWNKLLSDEMLNTITPLQRMRLRQIRTDRGYYVRF